MPSQNLQSTVQQAAENQAAARQAAGVLGSSLFQTELFRYETHITLFLQRIIFKSERGLKTTTSLTLNAQVPDLPLYFDAQPQRRRWVCRSCGPSQAFISRFCSCHLAVKA